MTCESLLLFRCVFILFSMYSVPVLDQHTRIYSPSEEAVLLSDVQESFVKA